ncbi:MAG: hypothetical protein JOY61_20920, partial [Chloroflexi bacterium]|nr:hypothetical protein [Chloroflexota bacterium]
MSARMAAIAPRTRGGGGDAPAPLAATLLVLFPVAFLAIGLAQLALVRRQVLEWQALTGAGLFGAGLLGAAIFVRWRWPRADPFLLP